MHIVHIFFQFSDILIIIIFKSFSDSLNIWSYLILILLTALSLDKGLSILAIFIYVL